VEAEPLLGRVAPRAVPDSRSSFTAQLSAACRLLRAEGFDHVIHAENIADKHFKIFFARNRLNNARLGIVASKKTLPKAIDRNRAKRFIREVFRHHGIKLCSLDLVVMVRRDYSREVNSRVESLDKLFTQVKKRCAE
jgi:ribonuclease P protein component